MPRFLSPERADIVLRPSIGLGDWIVRHLDLRGVMDLGGTDAISLGEVAEAVGSKSAFEGEVDDQILTNAVDGAPPRQTQSNICGVCGLRRRAEWKMEISKIDCCRLCESTSFDVVFDFGAQALSTWFPGRMIPMPNRFR